MKRILWAFAVLCLNPFVWAQGSRYDSQVTTVSSNVPSGANAPVMAIPGSQITICLSTGCPNRATIYSNSTLTVVTDNPFKTDTQGKFGFWANPGNYFLQVQNSVGTVLSVTPITVGGGSAGATLPPNAPVFGLTPTTSRAATATDIVNLWTTCGTNFLKGDGTCAPGGSGDTFGGASLEINAKPASGTTGAPTGMFTNAAAQNRSTLSSNPFLAADGAWSSNLDTCITSQNLQGYTSAGGGSYTLRCHSMNMINALPGWDYGTNRWNIAAFSVSNAHTTIVKDYSASISNVENRSVTKTGTSDINGHYYNITNYGGVPGVGDEGYEGDAVNGGEANSTFQGTVVSVMNNQQLLTDNGGFSDGGNQGDNRYVWDMSLPLLASNDYTVSLVTGGLDIPNTFILHGGIDSSYVSTFWGTLTNEVPVNTQTNPPFTTATAFNVTKIGGGSPAVGSEVICFSGSYHECAKITNVINNGGGSFTITAPLQRPHGQGSWIMQGKGAFALDYVANRVQVGGNAVLRYPVECIGATDTTHAMCGDFAYGSMTLENFGNVTSLAHAGTQVSNTAGVVTIPDSMVSLQLYMNQSVISFSGATPSQFNGTCTNTRWAAGVGLQCDQAASTGMSTSVAPSITVGDTGVGNTRFDSYGIASVTDVRNPTTHNVDGTFLLEPNTIAWAPTNIIEQQHAYIGNWVGSHKSLVINNPRQPFSLGIDISLVGKSVHSSNGETAGILIRNREVSGSHYIGNGGTVPAPAGIKLDGFFQSGYSMTSSPFLGLPLLAAGCPPTTLGCTDPDYWYNIASLSGDHASDLHWQYYPERNLVHHSGAAEDFDTLTRGNSPVCTADGVGGGSCGGGGSGPTIQTNGSNNTLQTTLNFITSTANTIGLNATPSNPATGNEKFEITGSLALTAMSGGAPGAADSAYISTSTSLAAWKAIGSCSGASNALTYNTSTHAFGCNTISGGGATIPSVTNLINGSGTGNGADSGIAVADVMTLSGNQTVTGTKTFTGSGVPIGFTPIAIASLPTAATAGDGAVYMINDSNTTTTGTCTAGGANRMLAISNGTTWTCH